MKIPNAELLEYQKKSSFDKVAEVFGDRNVLWWLLPVNRFRIKRNFVERELNRHYVS